MLKTIKKLIGYQSYLNRVFQLSIDKSSALGVIRSVSIPRSCMKVYIIIIFVNFLREIQTRSPSLTNKNKTFLPENLINHFQPQETKPNFSIHTHENSKFIPSQFIQTHNSKSLRSIVSYLKEMLP